MKSKILISLLLALVMLITLATPAFAAKPIKTELREYYNGPVVGKVSYQVTHDNHLRITVVLEGALAGTTYLVSANYDLQLDSYEFTTGNNGNGRFKVVTGRLWDDGETIEFWLYVFLGGICKYNAQGTTIEF